MNLDKDPSSWAQILPAAVGTWHPTEVQKFAEMALHDIKHLAAEVEIQRGFMKRLSTALLNLRPLGGSELFTNLGGEFYADPDYCGRIIGEMRAEINELRKAKAFAAKCGMPG